MRRTFVTVSVLALLIGGARLSSAQPKGERATIKGEVVDLWCYLEGGDRGPAKADCATACAKAGNPIGVLDAKVIDHYSKPPIWWRQRLDCGGCPTLAEAEQRLHPAPPAPTSDQKTARGESSAGSEEDEDDEGWENAWE